MINCVVRVLHCGVKCSIVVTACSTAVRVHHCDFTLFHSEVTVLHCCVLCTNVVSHPI